MVPPCPVQFDMYVIGLEECHNKDDWFRAISQLLSPTFTGPAVVGPADGVGYLTAVCPPGLKALYTEATSPRYVGVLQLCCENPGEAWRAVNELRVCETCSEIVGRLELRPEQYVCVGSATLWGIHMFVFARQQIVADISGVQVRAAYLRLLPWNRVLLFYSTGCWRCCGVEQISTEATGIGGVMGNKGGVTIGFTYRETTRLAFVASHLAARATRQALFFGHYSLSPRVSRLLFCGLLDAQVDAARGKLCRNRAKRQSGLQACLTILSPVPSRVLDRRLELPH